MGRGGGGGGGVNRLEAVAKTQNITMITHIRLLPLKKDFIQILIAF